MALSEMLGWKEGWGEGWGEGELNPLIVEPWKRGYGRNNVRVNRPESRRKGFKRPETEIVENRKVLMQWMDTRRLHTATAIAMAVPVAISPRKIIPFKLPDTQCVSKQQRSEHPPNSQKH